MKIKSLIILIMVILIQTISYASYQPSLDRMMEGAATRQYINDINSGNIELWHTYGHGWDSSSWGRWKYYNNMGTKEAEQFGSTAKGWCKIDGDWYYFNVNDSIMVVNTIIDGFQIGADGRMIKNGVEPSGMDYDTTYSYLKVVNAEEQHKAYSKDQVYIKNTLKVKKDDYVTIHKPIFAGDDNEEVNEISSQFDEMFESVIEDNFNYDDVTEKTDISVRINSVSSAGIVIKILKEDKSGLKTLETLWYDRDEKNLTTYSDYCGDK